MNGGDTTSLERSREDTARYRNDTIRFQISEQENEFRAAIEERERFNLSLGMKEQNHDYYHFFPPVEGIVPKASMRRNGITALILWRKPMLRWLRYWMGS